MKKGMGSTRVQSRLRKTAIAMASSAAILAFSAATAQSPVDLANPLVGTAPLDDPAVIGNAPPPGEPVYSGQTSPGARLPHGSVAASPVNNNIELLYPNGVPVPYYYTNPTMIGFTGGGGSTYGGGAEPIVMPVVGDWSPPPAYSQSYYDKSREKASPGYYSVYLDTFRTQVELTATRWASVMRFTFPQSDRSNVIVNVAFGSITAVRLPTASKVDAVSSAPGPGRTVSVTRRFRPS